MGIRKVIKKKLTPKGRRIENAKYRLSRVAHDASSKARGEMWGMERQLGERETEYKKRIEAGRRELGYAPGEPVERAVSGTDRYSGSSYRIGRGIPRVSEETRALRTTSDEDYKLSQLRKKASSFKSYDEIESRLKQRLRSDATSKFRKTRPLSKTEKVLRGGKRAIKGGAIAALAAAVLAEINKKKD